MLPEKLIFGVQKKLCYLIKISLNQVIVTMKTSDIGLQRIFQNAHSVIWQNFQGKLSKIGLLRVFLTRHDLTIFLDLKFKVAVNYVAYIFAIRKCFFEIRTSLKKIPLTKCLSPTISTLDQ